MSLFSWDGKRWHSPVLKDSQRGKVAIIVCNGPSLNSIDPVSLCGPNRYVIAVNNAYPKVRPDCWIGMDLPKCYNSDLWNEPFPKIARGPFADSSCNGQKWKDVGGMFFAKVSEKECQDSFPWNKHTLGIALYSAVYMGMNEIVLIGVDLDNSNYHYADGNYLTESQRASNQLLHDEQYLFLQEFNEMILGSGGAMVSCSDGSRINDFLPHRKWGDIRTSFSGPSTARVSHCAYSQECNEFQAMRARGGKPYSAGHQAMYKCVAGLLGGVPADILEVGVGIGYGLELLDSVGAIKSYYGTEPCVDSYNYSLKFSSNKIQVVNLPGIGECRECDFSICIETIEHVAPSEATNLLSSICRATNNTLFLSTPDSSKQIHGVYTQSEMINMLKKAGFTDVVAIDHQWTVMYIAKKQV